VEGLRELLSRYGREVLLVATVDARRTGRSPVQATVDAFLDVFRAPLVPNVRRHLLVHAAAAATGPSADAVERVGQRDGLAGGLAGIEHELRAVAQQGLV